MITALILIGAILFTFFAGGAVFGYLIGKDYL